MTIILYNILSLIITVSLVFFSINIRLSRKILETPLDAKNIIVYYNFFLYFFCLSLILLFYLLLLQWLSGKNNNNSFLNKLSQTIQKYNVFYRAYVIILEYLGPPWLIYLVIFAKYFVHFSKNKLRIFIITFVVLPRVIIICTLFLETFLFKSLHYYFYSLLLLFLPLFFSLFVFIFNDLSPRLLPEFQKYLDIKSNSLPKQGNYEFIGFSLKPEYSDLDMDDLMHNYYYPMLFLQGHMEVKFMPKYRKISFYMLFVYFLFHAIIWGYLLSHNALFLV